MPSIKKRFADGSSLVYQSLLHIFLRDFTNYYWHKEQSQWLTETQNVLKNYEALNNNEVFETEESYGDKKESIDVNINIEENEINDEGSDETGDTSSNDGSCNSCISIKKECTIENLGDCIQKDNLGDNYFKKPFSNKNKNFKTSHDEDFNSYLSLSPDEVKGTSLKKNLSYTVVVQKSDGDSLTSKILNNENYLGNTTFARPASTSSVVLEEQDGLQENLVPHLENEYESLNDWTVCFRDYSKDPSNIAVGHPSESAPVDEDMTDLPQQCETRELSCSVEQNSTFNSQNTKFTTVKTTQSTKTSTGRPKDDPKPCEETPPTDTTWNIGSVQEKIQNLLSALTSNLESIPDNDPEPAQKPSDTSYYDSDNVSDTETYDELVKKVLSGTKSDVEMSQTEGNRCTCMERQGCLQVVEFDEADELLTTIHMSSVDTGSVSDWLYSVPPAICLPSSMSTSTIETSEDSQSTKDINTLADGKKSNYRDEVIAKTLFTHKWVGDTAKYCT